MPSERCSEGNFYRFLLTLSQQLQDLHGVGGCALAHLIATAIPLKNYVFSGTPMQLDFARMNRSKSYAGLPAGWCCGYVTGP